MRRNKISFLMLLFMIFASKGIVRGDALSYEKFFKFTEKNLIVEKEVSIPEERLYLPEVLDISGDGNVIYESVWKEGNILEMVAYPNKGVAIQKTKVAICFDEEYLYISFLAEKNPKYQLKARKQEKEEGHIWTDDNFEVFLDPFLTRSKYYHFIINPLGEIYDAECVERLIPDPKATDPSEKISQIDKDLNWKSKAVVWTKVEKDRWGILVKIPFSDFGVRSAPKGCIWGANFCHTNWEINELSQWKVTTGGFHQPREFGVIAFGKKKTDIDVSFKLPVIGYGDNIINMNYDNKGENRRAKVINTLTDGKGEKINEGEKSIVIPKGKGKILIPFSIPFGEGKEFQQITNVVIERDYSTYYVKNIYLPEVLEMKIKLAQIYTTDKQIEGNIRINLGEGALKDVKLKFEISNKENNYWTEMKAEGNNYVKFGINIGNLTPGEYLLKVSAIKEKEEIGSCMEKIYIVSAPFEF